MYLGLLTRPDSIFLREIIGSSKWRHVCAVYVWIWAELYILLVSVTATSPQTLKTLSPSFSLSLSLSTVNGDGLR